MAPAALTLYALWISAPIFHLALALIMRRHGAHLRFEVFYSYLIFKVCRSVLLFVTYKATAGPEYHAYFWLFWISEAVEIVLSLAVIYELYDNALAQYDALRRVVGVLFRWVAAMLILMSTVAVASSSGADSSHLMVAVLSLKQTATIVRAGLLLLLFLAASFLGLKWKHYVFGIALGCALHASVELVAVTVRVRLGEIAYPTWPVINGIAYHCAVLIWIVYLVSREPQLGYDVKLPSHDLDIWNDSLQEIIRR